MSVRVQALGEGFKPLVGVNIEALSGNQVVARAQTNQQGIATFVSLQPGDHGFRPNITRTSGMARGGEGAVHITVLPDIPAVKRTIPVPPRITARRAGNPAVGDDITLRWQSEGEFVEYFNAEDLEWQPLPGQMRWNETLLDAEANPDPRAETYDPDEEAWVTVDASLTRWDVELAIWQFRETIEDPWADVEHQVRFNWGEEEEDPHEFERWNIEDQEWQVIDLSESTGGGGGDPGSPDPDGTDPGSSGGSDPEDGGFDADGHLPFGILKWDEDGVMFYWDGFDWQVWQPALPTSDPSDDTKPWLYTP